MGSCETEPFIKSFSNPPTRCSKPFVGYRPASGKPFGVAFIWVIGGCPFGNVWRFNLRIIFHAWDKPGFTSVGKYPSVRRMTGVICSRAIFAALKAQSKQLLDVLAATTATGAFTIPSEEGLHQVTLLCFRGQSVDGPPRCTSTITRGNSVITARPMASVFSERPGPMLW